MLFISALGEKIMPASGHFLFIARGIITSSFWGFWFHRQKTNKTRFSFRPTKKERALWRTRSLPLNLLLL